jgi:hypothetical protein
MSAFTFSSENNSQVALRRGLVVSSPTAELWAGVSVCSVIGFSSLQEKLLPASGLPDGVLHTKNNNFGTFLKH